MVAYCLYCIGFALAGTGLAVGLHAAMGQTCTAFFSRILLKRKLTGLQISAVIFVPESICSLLLLLKPVNMQCLLKEQVTWRHVIRCRPAGSGRQCGPSAPQLGAKRKRG